MVDVGKNIRLMRQMRSLTQKQLAQRLGVSESYVSEIENGANISIKKLQKFAEALQTNVKIFLEEDILSLPLSAFAPVFHRPEEIKKAYEEKKQARLRIRHDLEQLLTVLEGYES